MRAAGAGRRAAPRVNSTSRRGIIIIYWSGGESGRHYRFRLFTSPPSTYGTTSIPADTIGAGPYPPCLPSIMLQYVSALRLRPSLRNRSCCWRAGSARLIKHAARHGCTCTGVCTCTSLVFRGRDLRTGHTGRFERHARPSFFAARRIAGRRQVGPNRGPWRRTKGRPA